MSRNRKNNVVKIEGLEARTLMTAVALTVTEVAYQGGTQLQIIGTAGNDQITVKQTNAGLVIGNTGGWTKTVTDKINSLYINGEAGNNSITLDASVTLNATIVGGGGNDSLVAGNGNNTLIGGSGKNLIQSRGGNDNLVSIGSTADTLIGGTGSDIFWTDNNAAEKTQNVSKNDTVHKVGGFINGAAIPAGRKVGHTAASSIKEPGVDAGVTYASFSNDPIFSSAGPSEDDIYQGEIGDCYYLSVLSSVAKIDPSRIQNSIVDLGDGTVVVELFKNNKAVYVHESENLPVSGDGALQYAGLGAQNCTWVALMEKAFTYVRSNTISYAAIDSGWMDESYVALGGSNISSTYTFDNATDMLNTIKSDLAAGQSVTMATDANPTDAALVSDHAYTVDSVVTNKAGVVTGLTLRNPWGCDANGNGNGYITLTTTDAFKSFGGMVSANV